VSEKDNQVASELNLKQVTVESKGQVEEEEEDDDEEEQAPYLEAASGQLSGGSVMAGDWVEFQAYNYLHLTNGRHLSENYRQVPGLVHHHIWRSEPTANQKHYRSELAFQISVPNASSRTRSHSNRIGTIENDEQKN
jgi:hypothetical protein